MRLIAWFLLPGVVAAILGWDFVCSIWRWIDWDAIAAIATAGAAVVAVVVYWSAEEKVRYDRDEARRDRQAEMRTMELVYLNPVRRVITQCRKRRDSRILLATPIEAPSILKHWLDRNWILGEIGVDLNHLYDRIAGFNDVAAEDDSPERDENLRRRIKAIEDRAISLRNKLRAKHPTARDPVS